MSKYTVITGDIINSKDYKNIINNLSKKIDDIDYPNNNLAPFAISRGDEIQTVFEEKIELPKFLRRVRYKLKPLEIRFGIGYGKIEGDFNDSNSWNMSGSAFYNAREALNNINKNEEPKTMFISNNKIDQAINTILFLIDTLQSDWSKNQWEAIYYYDLKGTYKKTAKELNIAFQNVEKRCKAAKWKKVEYAENNLINIMDNFL